MGDAIRNMATGSAKSLGELIEFMSPKWFTCARVKGGETVQQRGIPSRHSIIEPIFLSHGEVSPLVRYEEVAHGMRVAEIINGLPQDDFSSGRVGRGAWGGTPRCIGGKIKFSFRQPSIIGQISGLGCDAAVRQTPSDLFL